MPGSAALNLPDEVTDAQPLLNSFVNRDSVVETVMKEMQVELKDHLEADIQNHIAAQEKPEPFIRHARLDKIVARDVSIRVDGVAHVVPEEIPRITWDYGSSVPLMESLNQEFVGRPANAATEAALSNRIQDALQRQIAEGFAIPENALIGGVAPTAQSLYQYMSDVNITTTTSTGITSTPLTFRSIQDGDTYRILGGAAGASSTAANYQWYNTGLDTSLAAGYALGTNATTPGTYNVTYTMPAGTYAAYNNMNFTVDATGQWNAQYVETKADKLKRRIRQQLGADKRKRAHLHNFVTPPELKARDTLRDMLSEADWRRYVTNGFIMVRGDSGKWYQVFARHNEERIRVYENNRHTATLCIHSSEECPLTDHVIAMKIQIEVDEDSLWREANKSTPFVSIPRDAQNPPAILEDLIVTQQALNEYAFYSNVNDPMVVAG